MEAKAKFKKQQKTIAKLKKESKIVDTQIKQVN